MAADQRIRYIVEIDPQTANLERVQAGLREIERQGGKLADSLDQGGKKAGLMGQLLTSAAVGGILNRIMQDAMRSSDAMGQLNEEFSKFTATIVQHVEPALSLISRGLQGLMITIAGSVGGFMMMLHGKIADGLTKIGDAIAAGGERAQGLTQAAEKDQSEIVIKETMRRLKTHNLSIDERLRILSEGEAKALAILRASGKYAAQDEEGKALMEEQILRRSTMARQAYEQQRDQLNQAALEGELATINQASQERLALEGDTNQQQLAIVTARIETEKTMLDTRRASGLLTEQQYQMALAKVTQKGAADVAKIVLAGKVYEKQVRDMIANQIINVETALGQRLVQLSFQAAEQGKMTARDFARELVKTAAQAAADGILAYGALAAAKAAAAAAVGGPIAAAIAYATTYAPFVGIAAAVAALGGAAARSIGGGGGGGGGGSPATPEAPVGSWENPARSAATPAAAIAGSAPFGEGGGVTINNNVSIQTLDRIDPEAVTAVTEALGRQVARG